MSKAPDKPGTATGLYEGDFMDTTEPTQGATTDPGEAAGPSGTSGKAKPIKMNTTHQNDLMQVFQNITLKEDFAPTNISDDRTVDNASTIDEEVPADLVYRDEGGACSSRSTNPPKKRKRKNRYAKKDRAYMISGVGPIEPKKTVPTPALPAKPTLSEQEVVPETSRSCQSSPQSLCCECSPDELFKLEGSDTEDFFSDEDISPDGN